MFHAQMHANHHLRLSIKGRKAVHIPCKFRAQKNCRFFYAHKLTVSFIYQYFILRFALCTKNRVFIGLPVIRSCFLIIKSYLYIYLYIFSCKNIQNILNLLLDTHSTSLIPYICIFFFKSLGFI